MESLSKRKIEDSPNILSASKKLKTNVLGTNLFNSLHLLKVKQEFNSDVDLGIHSLDSEDGEKDPFHDTDKMDDILNTSEEVSEDGIDSDDIEGLDSEVDDTEEEDKTLNDVDDDDDPEDVSGEYLGDDEDMVGVEAILDEEDNNGEVSSMLSLNDVENDLQCKKCFKTFARKSYLSGHSCSKDLEINNKALKCKFCHKRYSHKINLRLHLKLHNNPEQFQCHLCLKYLSSSSSLRVHIKSHTSEKAFKCEHCPLAYNQKVHLNDHVLSHHTNMRPYNCHLCNKTYVSKSVLKKHLKKHLGLYKHSCEVCGKLFFESCSLKKHMRTHKSTTPLIRLKSDEPLQCHSCLTYFHFKYKLIAHQMLEHGLCKESENCYQCPLCDIKFNITTENQSGQSKQEDKNKSEPQANRTNVKSESESQADHTNVKGKSESQADHTNVKSESESQANHTNVKSESESQANHTDVKIENDDYADGNVDSKMNAQNPNNLLEPEYPTHLHDHKSIFEKLKITPANVNMVLSEHIKSHEYVENHMCELCFKVFECRVNLIRHLKIHDDKERKRFKCEQCEKRFSTNVDLVKHTRAVHEKLRLHECDSCGKNFSQRNNLKRHLEEVHRTDGVKFECYVCSKVLATGHSLKRHLLIHNGPKYTCDICQHEFTRIYELNIHKKFHENESLVSQLTCPECGKTFLKRSNLKAHIENNHLDYTCLECQTFGVDIKFDTKKNLLLHLKTQHKNVVSKMYLTCTICFKTFLNDNDLAKHMKMHEDDNQIQCQFCHRYFSRSYNLKMHLRTCTKNKSNGILTLSDNDDDSLSMHENEVTDMLVPEIKMEYEVNDNYELEEAECGEEDDSGGLGEVRYGAENENYALEEAEQEDENFKISQHFDNMDNKTIIHVKPEPRDPLTVEEIIRAGEVSITPVTLMKPSAGEVSITPIALLKPSAGAQSPIGTSSSAIISDQPKITAQCHICLKTFAKRDSLKNHMKVYHTYIPPELINSESGEVKPILETILKSNHSAEVNVNVNATIICKICKKTFTRKDSLMKHMRRFHIIGDSSIKKEITEGEINRNMLDVILKESGHEIKSRIPCKLCYKTFTRKDSLRKHMKIFHSSESDVSKPQPVENKQDAASDVKVKTEPDGEAGTPGENSRTTSIANVPHDRIPCLLCEKTFTRKDSLKKHMRIFHSQCQAAHDSGNNSRRSLSNNVPFIDHIRCELCDKSFTRKDSLMKHNRNFHGGADPLLMDANMTTGGQNFLEVVLDESRRSSAPATNQILCRICNKTFTRNYNLKKHMKTVHQIDDSGPYFGYELNEDETVEQFGSLSNSMLQVIMNEEDEDETQENGDENEDDLEEEEDDTKENDEDSENPDTEDAESQGSGHENEDGCRDEEAEDHADESNEGDENESDSMGSEESPE